MRKWLRERRQRQLRRLRAERAASVDGERADYIYAPDTRRLERQLGRSAAIEREPDEAATIPGGPDPSRPWPRLPIGCELPVGGLVSEGAPDQPCVSVTYDDPLGSNTWKILETFADFGMATTFFTVGKEAEQHPELTRAILACGHEIGNHSFSHVPLSKAPDHGLRQYARAQRVIERVAGFRTGVARPPSGKADDDVIAAAAFLRMTTVRWGPSPYWWDPYPRHVAQVCLQEIRPGRVILLHQNDAGAQALPYVLARGRGPASP